MKRKDFSARMDPDLQKIYPGLPVLDLTKLQETRTFQSMRVADANRSRVPSADVVREDKIAPGLNDSPEVRVRIYRPTNHSGPMPCLYWIHGGGHVMGQIDQDDPVMEEVVRSVGCAAISVEWRLSPEHPFPASMNDCRAGLVWVYTHAADLGIDPDKIAVGGLSSGGGSAAGLALLMKDTREVPVCFELLVSPMLDDRNTTPSSFAIVDKKVWSREANLIAWRAYVGADAGGDGVSPYAAPTRATDLVGLPTTFIAVGDLDLFVDENLNYAQRLIGAGVPTEVHVYPGAIHGFNRFAPDADVTKRFEHDRDAALRRAFAH